MKEDLTSGFYNGQIRVAVFYSEFLSNKYHEPLVDTQLKITQLEPLDSSRKYISKMLFQDFVLFNHLYEQTG